MNNNGYQIGFSDEFSYNNQPINYEITQEGRLQLYVEDCARALGVTQSKKLKDNTESITIRWERVYDDLVGIEKIPNLGEFKNLDNKKKKELRDQMKDMTITESEMYLWSFRVNTEQGKIFRDRLVTVVLPHLRKYGVYVSGMENMNAEQIKKVSDERLEKYVLRKFGLGVRKGLTGTIKEILKPSPNQWYIYANYTNALYRGLFGMDCKTYKESLGLKEKDNLRDAVDKETLEIISKAEDLMCNLIMSKMTDVNMLENLVANWHKNYSKKQKSLLK